MLRHKRKTNAAPDVVWSLYAEPERWKEWAPHVRSPRGLGTPVVEPGAKGTIRLAGALPIPVSIVSVDPGRSWSWQAGPLFLDHGVRPSGSGCVIEIGLEAFAQPETGLSLGALAESTLRFTYLPVVRALIANLARVAERQAAR